MLGFIKKVFVVAKSFFGEITLNATVVKCVSMNNQECKVRSEIVNVNSDEPIFWPFGIKTSKYSGSCKNINHPYAKLCVPDVAKNFYVRVFNLMSRTNENKTHIMALNL